MRSIRWIAVLLGAWLALAGLSASAQTSCSTIAAGPATWSGIVNTYYPGVGSASAGSTSISVGAAVGGPAIAAGDLVLVIQMQDASIDSSNSASYGGSGGGAGYTSLGSAGLYEYAVAAVGTGGGVVNLVSPLINSYTTAAANAISGQRTFQVVRVPQASSATITGALTAPAWNGSTGGIVAIDVAGNLTWGGQTINVDGLGFRGGGGQCSIGAGGTWANTDYRTSSTGLTLNLGGTGTVPNGAKGEGVAGTPIIVFTPSTPFSNAAGAITNTGGTDGTSGGYPNGSFGRGAPGNGGGGGTDGDPPTNDENTGGGGGGNYGIGGKGGFGWTPGTPPGFDTGGFGGMSVPNSPQRLFFGGGGGAGSTNNCTGTPGFGAATSGASGGGMVFVRAGSTTGTATINARGTAANSTITNDASGGGGAGGSVLVFVDNSGAAVGATINVQGGNGGSNTGGGAPHGPGGGGSGGFALLSGTAVVNAAGGANGTTATSATSTADYGSTSSVGGFQIVNLTAAQIPGAGSSKACFPQLTVTKSTSTPFVSQGGLATWTITASNLAGRSAATGVSLTDAFTNPNITYASNVSVALAGGATRAPVTDPAGGANPATWSTFSIPGGGSVAITFRANVPASVPVGVVQNPATVTYLDPTRTAAQTVTPGGTYTAGGTVGGSNYASGSSTNEDITVVVAPTLAKAFNPTAIAVGGTTALTVTIANPSAVPLSGVGLVDTYPAGIVNTAAPGATTTCTGATVTAAPSGTSFTLAGGSIPAAGSCTVTVNVTMTSPGPYTNTLPVGALTTAQGVSNLVAASATLFTTLRVVKSFAPNAVPQNTDSQLSLDIVNDNTAAVPITNLTDTFPANLVATGGAVTVTGAGCTGFAPATVAANATSVTFTAGNVPAASTCRLTFAVRSAVVGTYANTTSGVTANGTTGPASNTANLGVGLINIAKSFAPASIVTGGTTTVTLTLTNPTGIAQTGGSFTDTLVNMSVASNQTATGCSTSTPLTAGQTALSFAGLAIPAAGCSISFTVTSNVVGTQTNTTSGVATAVLPVGPVSNTASLNVLGRPTIAKGFSPATISPGGTSTLTFTVANPGPQVLTGMAFTDTYPANLVNATPLTVGGTCVGVATTAAAGGGTFNVTGGSIPANSSCTITVLVTSNVAGNYTNTASGVTTNETAPGAGTTSPGVLVVAASPTITKAFGTSPISQGGTSVVTFTISNPNSAAAVPPLTLTNLNFTDTLTGMAAANGTIGGTCVGTTNAPALVAGATSLNLTVPSLAAGASCTVTVTVTSSTSGTWPNTTSGVSSTQTPVRGTASNTPSLVVLSPPTLAKAFIPSIIQSGGTTSIRFTVTNPNAGTALTNVTFSDPLANMALGAAPAIVETCSGAVTPTGLVAGSTNFTLALNTLAAGESCTITVSPVTSSVASSATGHANTTSTISSTQTGANPGAAASANLVVYAPPTVTKAFAPTNVIVNGTSVITFTVTNPNALPLSDIRFTDDLPANLSNNAAQTFVGGARGTCTTMIPASKAAGVVDPITFTNINLAPGASCTVLMDVFSGTAGFYTNTVTNIVSDQTPTATTGGSDTLTVGARMLLTESFTPATIEVGGTTTLRWLIQNNNAGNNQQNIDLTATLPAGLQAVGGAVTLVNVAGTCTFAAAPVIAAGATTITLTNYITDMDIGDDCAVDIQVTATTVGDKAVTVTAPPAGNPTSIDNATDTQTLIVYARPTIAKAFAPATIAAGGTSTITFTLANTHPTRALTGAAFTDTLANMAVSGAQNVGGTCTLASPIALTDGQTALSFTGITIPAAGNCTLTVLVTSATPGTQPNTTSGVTSTQTPTAGTASNTANLTVAGINITKAFAPAAAPVGVPVTLTLTLTSTQSVAWPNLAFTDTLPANLVVANPANASTTCAAGTVTATPGANVVSLAGGTMAAGASPCTVTVSVVSAVVGTYTNAAGNFSGLSTGASYTGGNVSVNYFPASTIAKAFAPAQIGPGGVSTLSIGLTNPNGASAVTGLGFTDTLPAGVVVAATPAATNTCGGTFAPVAGGTTLTLSGASLGAGPATCTLTVNVTASTVGTYTNNSANFSGLAGGLSAAAANASLNVVGTTLAKAFSPTNVGPGTPATLTFTITNGGGNPAQTGLAFTDTFPANLVVAATPAVANTCGGTFTATAGATSVALANGTMAAATASCTISVNVVSSQPGTYNNTNANISGATPSMSTGGVNATLTVNAPITATKAFGAATIPSGGTTSLTLTFTNANATAVTGLAFTDVFPVAPGPMTVADAVTSNTCGGTFTDTANGALGTGDVGIKLTGGTVPANGTCSVTVNVTATTAGAYTNTLAANSITTTNAGAIGTATNASLTVFARPTITKAFGAATIPSGGTTSLTITLSNANAVALAGAAFTDTLPVAPGPMTIANATTSNTCGGTLTDTGSGALGIGDVGLVLSGGTIPANGSCTISVNVTATSAGTYSNTIAIGGLTTTNGGANTVAANATVDVLARPTIAKSFGATTIPSGGTTSLTVTLTNTNAVALTGATFTDTLPVAPGPMTIANATTSNTCGGTLTDTGSGALGTGDVGFVLAGGTIPANGSCAITVNVTATTTGTYTNTIAAGGLATTNGGTNAAATNANLSVLARPTITKSFGAATLASGGTTSLTLTLSNANAVALTGAAFTDTLPVAPGPMTIANATTSNTCGGTLTDTGSGALGIGDVGLVLSGGTIPANGSCAITVNVTASTAGTYTNTIAAGGLTTTNGGASTVAANASIDILARPTITKAFGAANIPSGGTTSLTITLANPNAVALTGAAFTDTLPVAPGPMTIANATTSNTCGGTLTDTGSGALGIGDVGLVLSGGTIPANGSCAITVNVTATTTGTYSNTIAIGGLATTNGGANTAAANATVDVLARPTIAKSFGAASIPSGGTTSLTVTLTNTNTVALTGATFTDTLPVAPGAMTIANATTSNTCGGTLTDTASGALGTGDVGFILTGGTIPASGSCAVTVNVTASAAGAYTNTIGAGGLTTANGGSNAAAANANLSVLARPTITKAFGAANIPSGGTTSLTITLANANAVALTGAAFTDTLPVAPGPMTIANATTTNTCGGTLTDTGSGALGIGDVGLVLSGGTIPANGSCAITVNVTATTAGTYSNTIAIGGLTTTNGGANTAAANATLDVFARPTVTKAFGATTIPTGGTTTLTITLSNANATALTGAAFTDTYPANLVNSGTPAGATTCTGGTVTAAAGGSSVALAGGTIPANGSCTVTVNVTSSVAGTYANTIPVGGVTTANGGANTAAANASLDVLARPTITKAFGAANIPSGGTTSLTITLANANAVALTGAAFTDTLPAAPGPMTIANATTSNTCGGTLTDTGAGALGAGDVGLVLSGGTIPANGSCTISVNVTATTGGTYSNSIAIGGLTTTNGGANTVAANASLVVVAAPTIAKAFAPATIAADGTSTVTLTITNPNGLALTGASFTDTLANMSIAAAGAAGGTCVGANGNTFTAGQTALNITGLTIPANGSCTVTFVVTSDIPGANNNTTSGVASNQAPTGAASNTATLTVTAAVPTATKAFAPATITAGGTSTVTVTIANTNGVALTAAGFADTLTNMTAVGGVVGGTCAGANGNAFSAGATNLAVTGLTIPANGSCTVTFGVTSNVPGVQPNATAGVTSAQAAQGPASNTANLTVNAAAPTIAKAFAPATIAADGTSTVTLTIANPNGIALTGANFTDTLANMSIAAAGAAGGTCVGANGNTFTAGQTALSVAGLTIPANGSCTVTFVVTSDVPGANNNATSGVASTQAPTGAVSNTATLTVTAATPTVTKAFAPATITAGGTSTVTVTIANTNGVALTAASFTDTLANMSIATAGAAGGTCVGANGNTFTAGQTALNVTGLTVPANGSCTVTFVVTSNVPGIQPNTTSGVSSTQAATGAVSNTANLTVNAAAPTIAKAFAPATIAADGTSTVTLTIANPNGVALTGANFTDTLASMSIAAAGAAGGTCVGANTNTFTAGQTALTVTGLTIPANGSCTVTFAVTSDIPGANNNTTSGVASAQAPTGAASNTATLTVTAAVPTATKAFSPTTITAGGTSTVTVTIANTNGIALTAAGFADTLANMTAVGGVVGGTCVGANGNLFSAGATNLAVTGLTIPANGSCTVTFPVTSSVPGVQPNATAGVTSAQAAQGPASNTANLTVNFAAPTIAKAFAPATIAADGTSTVTLTIANPNAAALTGAGFTDTLANMSIAAAGAAGGTCVGANTNTFTAGQTALNVTGLTIPASGSCTVTFVVTSDVPGANNNTTSGVTSAQAPTGAASNTATLTVTAATPTVTKAFAPATITAGGTSTVTVTIANTNGVALTAASFTDTLANMSIASAGAAGGTCVGANGNTFTAGQTALAITGLTVPANGSCTVTFVVTSNVPGVQPNTTSGVSSNQAATGTVSNTANLTVTAAVPTIAKAFAPATIAADGTSTVTLTITNPNGVALTGANFTDTLANMSIAAAGAAGGTCVGANTNTFTAGQTALTVTGLTIPANGACTVTFVVTSDIPGTNPNTTSGVASAQAATGPASNTANLTVTAAVPTATKAFAPATITAGGTSTVTVTIANTNGIALTAAGFADTLANMTAVGGVVGGTCVGANGNLFSAGATNLAVTGLTIPANGSCTVTFDVTSSVPGVQPNATAGVTSAQAAQGPASNTANLTVNFAAPTIAKAFAPATIAADGTSTVTLTITNPNAAALTGASFTDTLANMSIAAAGAAGGTCVGANTNNFTAGQTALTVAGLTIPASGSCTVTFVVTSDVPGTNPNSTSGVASTQAPTGAASNTANLTVTAATPTATKAFAPATITAGGTSTVTVTIANTNGVALTAASFTDTLANMSIAAAGAAGGTCVGANGNTFTAGQTALNVTGLTVPANGSCTVTFIVTSNVPGVQPNTTSGVSSTQAATGAVSNTANLTVTAAVPTIAKAFAPATITADGSSTVTLTIANPNGVALTGAGFTDTLANMSIAAAGAAGGTCVGANTNTFTAGQTALNVTGLTIPANGSCTVTFAVTSDIPGSNPNTTSGVSSAQAATGPVSNTANLTVTAAVPTATKAFAPATITAGGTSTVTVTISNTNGIALTAAGFADTLANMTAVGGVVGGTCVGANGNTFSAGATNLAVTGLSIPANGSCTVTFDVTSSVPGVQPNATGGVTSAQAAQGPASNTANLTVNFAAPTAAKAFAPASITSGGTSTVTVTITNPNAAALTGAGFSDTLANMSAVGGVVGGTCVGANTNTFSAGATNLAVIGLTIPASGSCTVTFGVTSNVPGVQPNATSGVSSTQAPTGAVSNTANLTVNAAAPTIAKAFAPATIAADGTSTVTLTITNPNGIALTAAGFSDPLANMSAVGGVVGGTCVGANTNNIPAGATNLAVIGLTIPANGSCTVTFPVTSDVPGVQPNATSGVSSAQAPTGPVSNTANLTVTAAVPTISKAFAPATIAFGGTSTITFTIANTNGVALTGASFTDTLASMSVAAAGAAGGTCVGANANTFTAGQTALSVTGLTIPANGSCTVTVNVTSTVPGTHPNTASGVASNEAATGGASNTANLTVTAVAPTIAKAFAPATIASGGTSTLTITLSNANGAPVTLTSVTDTFPATPGTGLVRAATPNASTTCAGGAVTSTAGSVTLTGGTIPANGSCTFQIDVTAATAGSYANTIPAGALTTNAGANTAPASATLTVTAVANLSIAKTGPATIATGAPISYSIVVSNAGPDAADGAAFADTVPAAITGVGATCGSAAGGAACGTVNIAGNAVTSTITTLPSGGSVTFTVTGTAPGTGSFTNTATIAAPVGVADPVPGNNSSSVATTVLAPDLTITKTHVGNFTVGSNGVYTITVANGGTLATSGTITVTDALPAGLGFVSATGTGWTCNFASGTLTCTSATAIAPAASGNPITLTVSVASVAVPSVTNFATASGGNEPAANNGNNTASDNTIVVAAAVNTFAPNGAQTGLPGTSVFYPHTFNAGLAGSVVFTTSNVATPNTPGWSPLIYRDANCNGTLDGAEGATPISGAIAVNPGDQVCIIVRDTIPVAAPYNATNNITVTSTFNGTQVIARTDLTTVGAAGGAGLTLAKSVRNVTQGGAAGTTGSARPNDILEYTITYTNAGSGPLSAIVVTDATPSFTLFQSAACGAPLPGNITGCTVTTQPAVNGTGSIVWTLTGTLTAGGSGSVTYQVRVTP